MANANLRLLLSGDDKLSPTLKNVQQEINGIANQSKRLEQIQQDFERITNSSKPMKTQLRQIQSLLGQMNFEGLDQTHLFTQMAEHAGSLSDAIGDARQAVSAFADDNFKLEAMAQGMTLVASAGSIASGVMGLFGSENEKVTQAILKVQSALSILNGVQAVANVLNKDSALMLRLKQIRMVASSAATTADTTATTANTVSSGANSVAVRLNNSVRQKLNMTIAIGKALMGDWTGLLLVGASALVAYAVATSDSKDELEKENEATKKAQEAKEKYISSVASQSARLVSKYQELKDSYSKCRTEGEKTKWIKDNQTELHNLGLKVNDVITADNVFVNNSDKVIKAFELRAKAAALASVQTEKYEEYYKSLMNADNSVAGGGYYRNVKSGGKGYEQGSDVIKDLTRVMKRNGDVTKYGDAYNENGKYYTMSKGNFVLTEYGANQVNSLRIEEARQLNQKKHQEAQDELDKGLKTLNRELENTKEEFNNLGLGQAVSFENSVKDNNNNSSSNNNNKKNEIIDVNSVKYAEQELKKFQDLRVKIPIDETEQLAENEKQIKYWEKELERRKIAIKIETDYENNLNGLRQKLKDLEDERLKINPDNSENINLLNAEIEKLKKEIEQREIDLGIKPTISEGSQSDLETKIAKIQSKLKNLNIELNQDEFNKLMQELKDLLDLKEKVDKAMSFEIKPTINFEEDKFSRGSISDKRQSLDNAMNQINQIGSDYGNRLINKDEAESQIKDIIQQLQSLIPDLEIKVKLNDDGTVEIIKGNINNLGTALSGVGSAVNSMGQAMSNLAGENEDLAKAALITSAIGQLVLSFATSMKGSVTVWDWIAGAVAGVATLTSVIAQMQSFSTGGVVKGGSGIDNTLIRATPGEMVLNQRQQKNLFKALDSGNFGNGNNLGGGKVEFVIDGRNLKGVLSNVNSKLNRQS